MKTMRHFSVLVLFLAACTTLSFGDEPGRHPAYLHSLSDLRDARAHLDRLTPSDKMDREEEHAIREIDAAINEIKLAAIDDGKDLHNHVAIDTHLGHRGRRIKTLRKKKMTALLMDCAVAHWNILTPRTESWTA
jgi:hypothetical protein